MGPILTIKRAPRTRQPAKRRRMAPDCSSEPSLQKFVEAGLRGLPPNSTGTTVATEIQIANAGSEYWGGRERWRTASLASRLASWLRSRGMWAMQNLSERASLRQVQFSE